MYTCFLNVEMNHWLFQVMENLENFTKLQELWLGRNRIKQVNLCGLKCIKKISLQSNRLTSMVGFEVGYNILRTIIREMLFVRQKNVIVIWLLLVGMYSS